MARAEWIYEFREQRSEAGFVYVEYQVRDAPGRDVFLLNSHRMQLRTNHQRVIRGPNGGLMHVSGAEVLPGDDLAAFMLTPAWYDWTNMPQDGSVWRASRGRTLAPFAFLRAPWAGGTIEYLDPQWLREPYILPLQGQINEGIQRYLDRADRLGYAGDRRGTTLNLQVGASTDDAKQGTDDAMALTQVDNSSDDVAEHLAYRWTAVTISPGATIDNAILRVFITSAGEDEPIHQVRAEAADNPGTFTTTSNNIDSRTRTTAAVQWNSTNLGSGTAVEEQWGCSTTLGAGLTVETLVQEVVDRAGWVSGNALVFIAEQHTLNVLRDLATNAYDGNTAHGAKLDIDYTAAAGGRVMGALAGEGGLAGAGGLAGRRGGLAA